MHMMSQAAAPPSGRLSEALGHGKPSMSFEFFPPKTDDAAQRLYRSLTALAPLAPTFVSVTYGAGGTTRRRTHELVLRIHRETNLTVVPHLTCIGSSRRDITEIVAAYAEEGISSLLALRGDPPRDAQESNDASSDFPFAVDLIRFVRREFPQLSVGAACYPEGHKDTPNRLREIDLLKEKVDAGADWLTTQLFFDNHEFYDFRERCTLSGIEVPILAGIMPVTSRVGMVRMAELSPGTRFPAGLLRSVNAAADDGEVSEAGMAWATGQVHDLLSGGVDGVHFYTLNRSKPTIRIYESLGLGGAPPRGTERNRR